MSESWENWDFQNKHFLVPSPVHNNFMIFCYHEFEFYVFPDFGKKLPRRTKIQVKISWIWGGLCGATNENTDIFSTNQLKACMIHDPHPYAYMKSAQNKCIWGTFVAEEGMSVGHPGHLTPLATRCPANDTSPGHRDQAIGSRCKPVGVWFCHWSVKIQCCKITRWLKSYFHLFSSTLTAGNSELPTHEQLQRTFSRNEWIFSNCFLLSYPLFIRSDRKPLGQENTSIVCLLVQNIKILKRILLLSCYIFSHTIFHYEWNVGTLLRVF